MKKTWKCIATNMWNIWWAMYTIHILTDLELTGLVMYWWGRGWMLTCPHFLSHTPGSLHSRPCPLWIPDMTQIHCRGRATWETWTFSTLFHTIKTCQQSLFISTCGVFLNIIFYYWVCFVCTSAGADHCVKSFAVALRHCQALHGADQRNHTQSIKRSVKHSWHEFALQTREEKLWSDISYE